jgi:hypothetical protein
VPKSKKSTIQVQGHAVTVVAQSASDYISLTDIARYRNTQEPFAVINNWMRSRSPIEFIGLWEKLYNPDFKAIEFERFKNEAACNQAVTNCHGLEMTARMNMTSLTSASLPSGVLSQVVRELVCDMNQFASLGRAEYGN